MPVDVFRKEEEFSVEASLALLEYSKEVEFVVGTEWSIVLCRVKQAYNSGNYYLAR